MKILTLISLFWVLSAQASPKVEKDLATFRVKVAEMRAQFDKQPGNAQDREWVKAKLQHMVDVDQYLRGLPAVTQQNQYTEEEKQVFFREYFQEFQAIDSRHTGDFKKLLKTHGWFKISVWGETADENAWLLTQHADQDPAFQNEVLNILEKLWPAKETQPKRYAFLWDRVAYSAQNPSQRKLQRYGTQGDCNRVTKKWERAPVEDPEQLEARRTLMGISESLSEQQSRADQACSMF